MKSPRLQTAIFVRWAFFALSTALLIVSFNNCGPTKFQTSPPSSKSSSSTTTPQPGTPQPVPNLPQSGGPVGWSRIPNTQLTPQCPKESTYLSFSYPGSCTSVVTAWSGAVADTKRNRLIIWGGGHNDYYGNELYALDLVENKMVRLNDPTPLTTQPSCSVNTLADGRPNGRHTYGGLTYVAHEDKMLVLGGAISCQAGGISNDAWNLDLTTLAANPATGQYWKRITDNIPNMGYGALIASSDYDPISKRVLIYSGADFHIWDPAQSKFTATGVAGPSGYHFTGVVDPEQRIFFVMGNKELGYYDITKNTFTNLKSQLPACATLINAAYPGLAYHAPSKKIVGWAGGSQVFLIDPVKKTCEAKTFAANAPGPQSPNGTHGRFRYFPDLKAFVLVNSATEDAYLLRLE